MTCRIHICLSKVGSKDLKRSQVYPWHFAYRVPRPIVCIHVIQHDLNMKEFLASKKPFGKKQLAIFKLVWHPKKGFSNPKNTQQISKKNTIGCIELWVPFSGWQLQEITKAAGTNPCFQDACLEVGQHSPKASQLHAEYLQTIREPRTVRPEEGMVFMDTDVHSSDSELGDVLNLE